MKKKITDIEKKNRVLLYVRNPTFNFAGLNVIKFDAEKIIKSFRHNRLECHNNSTYMNYMYLYVYHTYKLCCSRFGLKAV